MLRAHIIRLETIMLNRVKLLANSTRVMFTNIAGPLKVRAVCLGALGLALVEQGLKAILEQSVFVFDLSVAIPFDTLKLSQKLWMCRIGTFEHIQFTVQLGYSFVINPEKTTLSARRSAGLDTKWNHTCHGELRILAPRLPESP